ncbi:terminase large subunit protein [Rhizobium phage RHph_Y52]|nr:terminase large subunit protein [Rhizobium phage RHph_Y21]QIG76781.1 terminase large subunit protein [Rhizobium phage RHph_Y52]
MFKIPENVPDALNAVRIERDRRECRTSLAEFTKRAWHIIEPSTKLVWGHVLDVMCAELEQIYFTPGFQPRLLMNVPPGTMKSILVSVMFPAWVWTLNPSKSFTGAAHEQGLAIRDARKMRIIVESDWYQARWPLKLAADQNAKTSFENEHRGFRQAVPFGSMTGRRSDFVIIDDPLSAEHANSPAHLVESERIFRETLPTRINNDESAIIMIMQRLNERDPSGVILADENRFGYRVVILPMRFDPERADPRDWRKVDGELLFPERYSEQAVQALERILGAYATAGQLQQRPVPREGGMFKLAWFEGHYVNELPQNVRWVRWWDLAATKDANAARTAGVLLGRTIGGRYIVANVNKFQEESATVRANIKKQAAEDKASGKNVEIFVPLDPGAGGKYQAKDIVAHLDGFNIRYRKEMGDKEERAQPFAAQCEAGNVDLLIGDWNKDFVEELCMFPGGKWKDQVDAVSNAHRVFVETPMVDLPLAAPVPVPLQG